MAYISAHETFERCIAVATRSKAEETSRHFCGFLRTPLRKISFLRLLRGGRLNDTGRLPRYIAIGLISLAAIWLPVAAYVIMSPERFTSDMSLILPGTGVSTSVNISDIGQASTSSNSAYSSSAISPTVTYQKLFQSGRVIARAARSLGITAAEFGRPRIRLIDQTSFMSIEMTGASPEIARERAEALLVAFRFEIAALRDDEISRREDSITGTVAKYQSAVNEIRDRISALQLETGLKSSDQYSSIVEANEVLRLELLQKQADLDEVTKVVSSLQALLDISPEAAAKTIKLQSDPEYAMLSAALSEATTKLAGMAERFGPRHPEMNVARKAHLGLRLKMLNRAMLVTGLDANDIQSELGRAADGERGALLADLTKEVAKRDGLRARIASMEKSYNENGARSTELITAASELDKLNRDYKVAEAVFTSALAKVNVSRTDIFASYPMAQVAEPPSLPWEPSSPNILLAIGAGILASIFSIFGLCLGWLRRPIIERLSVAVTGEPEPKNATE